MFRVPKPRRTGQIGAARAVRGERGAARGPPPFDPAELLSAILEISLEAIIVTDDRLDIVAASVGAERMFGLRVDEMVGANVAMLIPDRFRASHGAHVSAFLGGARRSLQMRGRGQIFGVRRDGSEVPVEATLSKRVRGKQTFFTVVLRDVTERRIAEAQLRASEQRLAIAIGSAELQPKLRSLQLRQDIIRTLHQRRLDTGREPKVLDDRPVRGRVVARGHHDELGGAAWVIVRDPQGQEHYARLKFGQSAPALGRGIELVPTPQGAQIKGPPRSTDLGL